MRVIIFHRKKRDFTKSKQAETVVKNKDGVLTEEIKIDRGMVFNVPAKEKNDKLKWKVQLQSEANNNNLLLEFYGTADGNNVPLQKIKLQLIPGAIIAIEYDHNLNKTIVRDLTITGALNQSRGVLIARLNVTSTEALLYLTRLRTDIFGFKNVIREADESSNDAFFRYSAEAKQIFSKLERKREFTSDIDPRDSLSVLEAQVDILTKVILESGIKIKEEDRKLLMEANQHSITKFNSFKDLERKMSEKGDFRKKQQEYLQKKEYTLNELFG